MKTLSRLSSLFLFILGAFISGASADPVTVRISDVVDCPDVKRLGINVNDTWWDTGGISRNRAAYNFEGTMYRSTFWGPAQDENGIYIWQQITDIPDGHNAEHRVVGAKFTLLNGPAKGETGLIQAVERRKIPNQDREVDYLVFDRPLPASDGGNCGILVEKNGLSEGHFNTIGSGRQAGGNYWLGGNAKLVQGDVDPDSFGQTALLLDASKTKQHIRLPGMNTKYTRYQGKWSLSFRAKATSGKPVIRLTEPVQDSEAMGSTWASYRFDFEVTHPIEAEQFNACLEVSDGAVLIDDILFRHEESERGLAFNDAFVDELRFLRPGILRYLNMGGSTVANHLRPPLERFSFSSSPWDETGPTGRSQRLPFSIHEFYELCAAIDAVPWFSLPGNIHPEEVEHFMEYLSAPADVGFGQLRAQQGQQAPWTEIFDEIIVEFGNEAWNTWGPFMSGGYNGPEYWAGLIAAGKNSPHYQKKIRFFTAGHNVNFWLNQNVIDNAPDADGFALATYMVHHLYKQVEAKLAGDENELFRWLFGYTLRHLLVEPEMRKNAEKAASRGIPLAVYETNHHAAAGDASSEFRNRFLTSLGGGLNVMQNMMVMLKEFKAVDQCFFTMFGITNNAYEIKDVRLFGAVLSLKEGEVRRRPHYLGMVMANRVMRGNLMEVTIGDNVPTYTAEYFDRKKKIWLEPETFTSLHVLSFADGEHRSAILLNLSVNEALPIQLEFDGEVVGKKARAELLHADSITANNELETDEPQVRIRDAELSDFRSGALITVPAHSMMTLRWQVE
jgi:alpha-L-arabinofuranosidase